MCHPDGVRHIETEVVIPGCAFSGRPRRLEILVGDWNALQWSPTGRLEIQSTILWL